MPPHEAAHKVHQPRIEIFPVRTAPLAPDEYCNLAAGRKAGEHRFEHLLRLAQEVGRGMQQDIGRSFALLGAT